MVAHCSIIRFILLALTEGQPKAMRNSLDPWRHFDNCEMRGYTLVGTSWQKLIDERIHNLLHSKEDSSE